MGCNVAETETLGMIAFEPTITRYEPPSYSDQCEQGAPTEQMQFYGSTAFLKTVDALTLTVRLYHLV